MLEPTDNRWVFALDMPTRWNNERITQTYDYQLVVQEPITEPLTYQVSSRPRYLAAAEHLSLTLTARDTEISGRT